MTTTETGFVPRRRGGFAPMGSAYADEERGVFIYRLEFEAERRRQWDAAIERMKRWSANPGELEDEDATAPSTNLLILAMRVAATMRDDWHAPPPQRVTPTNDGGIVFERWDGGVAEVLEFLPDRTVEIKSFYHDVLVRRQPVTLLF